MHFQFRNSCKNSKKLKKESTCLDSFAFISLCIFLHFNLEIHAKKKTKKFFKFEKYVCKKKVENIISKNHATKGRNAKKGRGVYNIHCIQYIKILPLYFRYSVHLFGHDFPSNWALRYYLPVAGPSQGQEIEVVVKVTMKAAGQLLSLYCDNC